MNGQTPTPELETGQVWEEVDGHVIITIGNIGGSEVYIEPFVETGEASIILPQGLMNKEALIGLIVDGIFTLRE